MVGLYPIDKISTDIDKIIINENTDTDTTTYRVHNILVVNEPPTKHPYRIDGLKLNKIHRYNKRFYNKERNPVCHFKTYNGPLS